MPAFDFDDKINRRAGPALRHHRRLLGAGGMDLFAGGVAHMDCGPCLEKDRLIMHDGTRVRAP